MRSPLPVSPWPRSPGWPPRQSLWLEMGPVWGPGAGGRARDSVLSEKLRVRRRLGDRPEDRSAPPAQVMSPGERRPARGTCLQSARPRTRRAAGGSHAWRRAARLSRARLRLCPGSGAGAGGEGDAPEVPFQPGPCPGSSPSLGRFQNADSAPAVRLRGLTGSSSRRPQRGVHSSQSWGAPGSRCGPRNRGSSGGPAGGGAPGRSRLSRARWPPVASPCPVLLTVSSPSRLPLLLPRPPPPRRSWKRPAAGRSRRRSPSTAAATWCRGRCTASSPSSGGTSGACRSAGRCGSAWPGAAGQPPPRVRPGGRKAPSFSFGS